ncbi:GNAT family N-acetyltransferase [Ilumatobacter sp.]|uniref:GNAT family N-acetyltransferase n=1 Tax=Ilumatobacter sp. TaxID=1967498 RepID=UPI003AF89D6A
MSTPTVRPACRGEEARVKQIAVDSGLFDEDDVDAFDEMLGGYFDGSLKGHQWLVAELDERIVGGAYIAPEPFGDRVWNLYFLAAAPEAQGEGVGTALLQHVEARLREMGPPHARVLIIETSSIETYSRTRAFYRSHGFVEESRIREFYGTGDDKVTFWKSLTA